MSNKLWPSVTRQSPCPICGKGDWCAIGDRAWKCMRVESPTPSHDGGWYHFRYERDHVQAHIPVPRRETPPTIDAGALHERAFKLTPTVFIENLGHKLGVSVEALRSIRAALWDMSRGEWAFPMRNGRGDIIGIRIRNLDGKKWAVTGSRSGIFIPADHVPSVESVYICEGPTDLAAALDLGLFAIARPSCNSGDAQVVEFLKTLRFGRAIIVTDNDDVLIRGRETYPGIIGARKLQLALPIRSAIWTPPPPFKDLRDFVNNGGTRDIMLSAEANLLHL